MVAEGAQLELTKGQMGAVVTEDKIRELPLNARNFTQLLTLTPGAAPVSVGQNAGGAQVQRIGVIVFPAINGQRNRSNSFTLDGVYNNAHFQGTYAIAPGVDALSQFKVQSQGDQAEFGGVSGGVVNIVSKGGTNEFHGVLYEFLRNASDTLTVAPAKLAGKPVNGPNRTRVADSQRVGSIVKRKHAAVMTSRWRLVSPAADGDQGRIELSDIRRDLGQKSYVAAAHPDVIRNLKDQYDAWWRETSGRAGEMQRIVLGRDCAGQDTLSSHDWHGAGAEAAWNKKQIRGRRPPMANGRPGWLVAASTNANCAAGPAKWTSRSMLLFAISGPIAKQSPAEPLPR